MRKVRVCRNALGSERSRRMKPSRTASADASSTLARIHKTATAIHHGANGATVVAPFDEVSLPVAGNLSCLRSETYPLINPLCSWFRSSALNYRYFLHIPHLRPLWTIGVACMNVPGFARCRRCRFGSTANMYPAC